MHIHSGCHNNATCCAVDGYYNQVNERCFGGLTGSATALLPEVQLHIVTHGNTVPVQTTAMAINLSAVKLPVTITDSKGCVSTANV